MYHRHNPKDFVLFNKMEFQQFQRELRIPERVLKDFCNLVQLLAKEELEVPDYIFKLGQ